MNIFFTPFSFKTPILYDNYFYNYRVKNKFTTTDIVNYKLFQLA